MRVDVVIPTIGRPSLRRAVESVNSQSRACSAIVVLDRPERRLMVEEMLEDQDYTLLVTDGGSKSASARNLGLTASEADYVAFLDDDDWWGPNRIAQLLDTVKETGQDFVVASPFKFQFADDRQKLVPRTSPVLHRMADNSVRVNRLADYLISRHDLRFGRNAMQTSTLLMTRQIALETMWDSSLRKHQDWDFILRLAQQESVLFYWSGNADCYVTKDSTDSISKNLDWKQSLHWLDRHGEKLSPKPRADFLYVHVLRAALAKRSMDGLLTFLRQRPGLPHLAAAIVGFSGVRHGKGS